MQVTGPASPAARLGFFARIWGWLIGWKEVYFTGGADPGGFASTSARRARYLTLWAHYEGNVYRKIHRWSETLKAEYQLYSYTRCIYNPAYRLGEWHADHVWGGTLDPDAGDGKSRPSCIPIVVPEGNEAIRPALAQLWRDSNWSSVKDRAPRFGAVLGDVGLKVVEDPARGKVYLEVVHPYNIAHVRRDRLGNVKEYVLEEMRPDPRLDQEERAGTPAEVTYREQCWREGGVVYYRTTLDGEPYDWRDYPDGATPVGPEWEADYGFIPLVWVQHRDLGLGAGWAEAYPALSKLHELDDQASRLNDQISKLVQAPWFIAGVNGAADLQVILPEASESDPAPERHTMPTITTSNPGASATAMVANLDISAASAHIQTIQQAIEADFPELQADMDTASGDASGRALRVARQRAESKVFARRIVYDGALVRAQMMALTIGSARKYEGYTGVPAGAFEAGLLNHAIGERPVFAVDPLDRLEEVQAEANALKTLVVDAGMPPKIALRKLGWSEEAIREYLDEAAAHADRQVLTIRRQQAAFGPSPAEGNGQLPPPDGGGNPEELPAEEVAA